MIRELTQVPRLYMCRELALKCCSWATKGKQKRARSLRYNALPSG